MQKYPNGFLDAFRAAVSASDNIEESKEDISRRVYEELQNDFPLVKEEHLLCFYQFCVAEAKLPFPLTQSFVQGIISAIDASYHSGEGDSASKRDVFVDIFTTAVLLPILNHIINIDAYGNDIEQFLAPYELPEPSIEIEALEDSVFIETDESEPPIEEDPDDFEWESYDVPNIQTEEETEIKLTSPSISIPWPQKVSEFFLNVDQSTLDMCIARHEHLHEAIEQGIKSLFSLYSTTQQDCKQNQASEIQKCIAQMAYILQNYMTGAIDQIPSLFPALMNVLDTDDKNTHVTIIKDVLRLNILSRVTQELSNHQSLTSHSCVSRYIKSHLISFKIRISDIKDSCKRLQSSSQEDKTSHESFVSSALLEVTEITKVLCFVVITERGQMDSEVASQLLEGQIIQSISFLLVSFQNTSLHDHSVLFSTFTSTCNNFLILSALYQPSICLYLGKLKSLVSLFSTEHFTLLFPQHTIIFHLLGYIASSYSSTGSLDRAVCIMDTLFNEEQEVASRSSQQVELLQYLVQMDSTLAPASRIRSHPKLKQFLVVLKEIKTQSSAKIPCETDEDDKRQRKEKRIHFLLKQLIHDISSSKVD